MSVYMVPYFMCKYNESHAQYKKKQQFSSRISRTFIPNFRMSRIEKFSNSLIRDQNPANLPNK